MSCRGIYVAAAVAICGVGSARQGAGLCGQEGSRHVLDTLISAETRLGHLSGRQRLAWTVALVAGMTALRWVFRDWLSLVPFLPYFPVVVACAFLFGARYSLIASLLGFVVAVYLFLPPSFSFAIGGTAWFAALLFLMVLLFTGWIIAKLKDISLRLHVAERNSRFLLAELNHRSKNNLQMVSSLLMLESMRTEDLRARRTLDEAVGRIEVIGQLHTLLYQGDAVDAVDAREFLDRLCTSLRHSFVGTRPITLRCLAAPLRLSVDKAVALGLVVNEAVTNALRHAFPGGRSGEILVTLAIQEGRAELIVADNGIGLGEGGSDGLGSRVIAMMGRQLGGKALTRPRPGGGTEVVARVVGG